jgi:hypothetical protein
MTSVGIRPVRTTLSAACAFALLGLLLAATGCESACPQQPTLCSGFRQLRLDFGAELPQTEELAAYRLTVRYATKQAGTTSGTTPAAGQGGRAGEGGSAGAGDSGGPDAAGAAGAGSGVDLDGVQQCVFTTPLDASSSFRCDAGPFYVTAEATSSASCGFVPGAGISVGCSGTASVFTVLRTSAPIVDVRVSIERNTASFAPASIAIPLETVYPDGPSCGSRCEQGSATVFVDALLANPVSSGDAPP